MSYAQDLRAEHLARRMRFQTAALPAPASQPQVPRPPVMMQTLEPITICATGVPICQPCPVTVGLLAMKATRGPKLIHSLVNDFKATKLRRAHRRTKPLPDPKQEKAAIKLHTRIALSEMKAAELESEHHKIAWQIIQDCAREFGITTECIFGGRAGLIKKSARQKAAWLIRHRTQWSFDKIARYLNRKNHSTIWASLKVFEERNQKFCAHWHAKNVSAQTLRDGRAQCPK